MKDCEYANPDEMIRDRIVFGTSSERVREKLINEGDKLTLEKAIQIAQTYEYSQQQLKTMSQQEVHGINRRKRPTREGQPYRQQQDFGLKKNTDTTKNQDERRQKNMKEQRHQECSKCGRRHSKTDRCPAQGKQCNKCGRYNHFANKCLSKKVINVHDVERRSENEHESDHEFVIDCIQCDKDSPSGNQAFCTLSVGSKQKSVKFKLDTGSQVNILPKSVFESLGGCLESLDSPNETLSAYDNNRLESLGRCHLRCVHQKDRYKKENTLAFHVVDTRSPPILGIRPCLDMGLIKLIYTCTKTDVQREQLTKQVILDKYKDVFDGIGLFEGKCSIQIDPTVPPVVHPPRRVPVSLKDRLQEELDRMESLGIITKVTEPTAWVSSLVLIQKPDSDKLRVCLDPRSLNEAILRPHYPSRTLEEILPELVGAKFFTKLDAKSGYWTCELTHQSSLLTTFNSPFGRYRYLRLPFGLKSSQDEFQKKLDQSLEGLKGFVSIADDIVIHGSTREEHDQRLHELLSRAREKGIKFNKDKLEEGVTEVKYFGHLLTDKGLKPDPDKVRAVQSMKLPSVRSELETFLGMVTYLSKFAPNLSE